MEHPCHKCGQPVEDGVPFCSHCGAPQIRVAIAQASPEPAAASDEASSPTGVILQSPQHVPGLSLPMGWSGALRACGLAAGAATLLLVLGLYPFVAILTAGILAVAFYRSRNPETVIKAAAGAKLGALSGLLCFGMFVIVGALRVALLHKGPEIRNQLLQKIEQAAPGASDPQAQAVFEYFKTPSGLAVMMLVGLVVAFFMTIVLASIGGALSATLLNRRARK